MVRRVRAPSSLAQVLKGDTRWGVRRLPRDRACALLYKRARMHVLRFALVIVSLACVAPGLAVGCSGSSSSSGVPTDASSTDTLVVTSPEAGDSSMDGPPVDAASEGGADAGLDPPRDSSRDACVSDADLATLSIDAALPDDASVTTCLECARTRCTSYVTTCDTDCACNAATLGFLTCTIGGQSLTSCAAGLLGEGNAFALGECMISLCQVPCGGGGEVAAGSGDGGDSGD